MSTFSGVEMSKRALNAHSRSLQTVGHNIQNINTEGYTKQRVDLKSMVPLDIPGLRAEMPGQIGQGVETAQIVRQRDYEIDTQIIANGHQEGYWSTRDTYISRLESIYNEVGDSSIRNMLDRYWEAWQDVSNNPEETAARVVLLERADTLMSGIRDRFTQLEQTRDMLDEDVIHTTNLINEYSKDIAELNHKIYQSRSLGDNPNDWEDRRDLLIEKLSKIINIKIDKSDPNEYLVHTNGKVLVQGDKFRQMELVRDATRNNTHSVRWSDTGDEIDYSGGELSSLVILRDQDVRGEIQKLNSFAIKLVDGTNNLHTQGYTLRGNIGQDFFRETPAVLNAQGNYDANEDGVFDQSRIFRLTGANVLDTNDLIGVSGQMTFQGARGEDQVIVQYTANDTVNQVIQRINNSGAEISAGLDANGKLTINAENSFDATNPDFVIRILQDSGEFLAGYSGILATPGVEGAFTWNQADAVNLLAEGSGFGVAPFLDPAGSMIINPYLRNQPQEIAASQLAQDGIVDVGDGKIALKISKLRTADVGFGGQYSFDDYFAESVASIATRGEEAELHNKTYGLIMDKLRESRSEVSGVSLDMEFQDMIKFQKAYAASARFLVNLNEVYDDLLNIV